MKRWFTSDWHLSDPRFKLNYRPFEGISRQNQNILSSFLTSGFKDGDELWHLGNVVHTFDYNDKGGFGTRFCLQNIRQNFPNSKFNLIASKDDGFEIERLQKHLFDNVYEDALLTLGTFEEFKVYLNHYPNKCISKTSHDNIPIDLCLVGEIGSLWKVQPNMINVGVDAWHFKPVPEDTILGCWNAIQLYYDDNVFPYN